MRSFLLSVGGDNFPYLYQIMLRLLFHTAQSQSAALGVTYYKYATICSYAAHPANFQYDRS